MLKIKNVRVYHDGSHYIGRLPLCPRVYSKRRSKYTERQRQFFFGAYKDAKREKIPRRELLEYIQIRAMNELDVAEWFTDEEAKELLKRAVNNEHKRKLRFDRKLNLNVWNYFATFTYDDKKETEDGFVKRLRKALSNLSTRNGWRYIGVRERGKESDRVHYHFIMYIPKGEMIGELFVDRAYSTKRKKWEFFTNNTYFNDRFGQSHWQSIGEEEIRRGQVSSYLSKYVSKSEERLIYSRHIPSEETVEIDVDTDVVMFFRQYGYKVILNYTDLGSYGNAEPSDNGELVIDRSELITDPFRSVMIR